MEICSLFLLKMTVSKIKVAHADSVWQISIEFNLSALIFRKSNDVVVVVVAAAALAAVAAAAVVVVVVVV